MLYSSELAAAPGVGDKRNDVSALAIKNPATGHFITTDLRIVGAAKFALVMPTKLFDWEAPPPASGLARAAPLASVMAIMAAKPTFPDVYRDIAEPPKVGCGSVILVMVPRPREGRGGDWRGCGGPTYPPESYARAIRVLVTAGRRPSRRSGGTISGGGA